MKGINLSLNVVVVFIALIVLLVIGIMIFNTVGDILENEDANRKAGILNDLNKTILNKTMEDDSI